MWETGGSTELKVEKEPTSGKCLTSSEMPAKGKGGINRHYIQTNFIQSADYIILAL